MGKCQRTGGPVTRRSPPTCRGGGGTSRATSARPEAEREGGGRELGLRQELVEERAPHVRAELLVEEVLEGERPAALGVVGRIERRLGSQTLEALDDARRVVDRLAVDD